MRASRNQTVLAGATEIGPFNGEHRDLEGIARRHLFAEHDAIGHVEALDGGGARVAAAARHFAVHPHFRVVVDQHPQNRLRARRFEVADFGRDRQVGPIPQEGDVAAAAARAKVLGLDRWPFGIVEINPAGARLDIVGGLVLRHGALDRGNLDDLDVHHLPARAEGARSRRRHQIDDMRGGQRGRHDRPRRQWRWQWQWQRRLRHRR